MDANTAARIEAKRAIEKLHTSVGYALARVIGHADWRRDRHSCDLLRKLLDFAAGQDEVVEVPEWLIRRCLERMVGAREGEAAFDAGGGVPRTHSDGTATFDYAPFSDAELEQLRRMDLPMHRRWLRTIERLQDGQRTHEHNYRQIVEQLADVTEKVATVVEQAGESRSCRQGEHEWDEKDAPPGMQRCMRCRLLRELSPTEVGT